MNETDASLHAIIAVRLCNKRASIRTQRSVSSKRRTDDAHAHGGPGACTRGAAVVGQNGRAQAHARARGAASMTGDIRCGNGERTATDDNDAVCADGRHILCVSEAYRVRELKERICELKAEVKRLGKERPPGGLYEEHV